MLRDILHPSLVFLSELWDRLLIAWPILVFLMMLIALMGLWVGRREGWRWQDSLYWAGITATTVGYGDIRPRRGGSRLLALLIAMIGLVFSGLVVALAVNAGQSMVELLR
ncbi:potassium channel family protein [Marinobacter mobilis]|uniref:Ion channel n=1 Tax=Marinobacter mobilis TaxID=488533 RepID=A0A1H3CGN0_9GAMM|nr:potassium channel family protein [Marinobacter mobilis]SDW75482.1 Ion channel [Marinobacter mobilis]SDX52649.1 Ion channel [Marinobacter mobilis]